MPDLAHSLQGRDLGFLRIVALLWGVELKAADTHAAVAELLDALHTRSLVTEVVESLPLPAHEALRAILREDGRLSWAVFTRRFGKVREMGPARRDRERPHLVPISPTEILWYRGLVSRAFFEPGPEPLEYAYIPDDLVPLLPALHAGEEPLPGRAATPIECANQSPTNDRILDQACTLLAHVRSGCSLAELGEPEAGIPWQVLLSLLGSAGLLDTAGMPHPENGRAFLEVGRGHALVILVTSWMESQSFNELRQLGGLAFEGEWSNDPRRARRALLEFLARVPAGQWWSLPAFIAAVKDRYPDYQRPAGDYDSWFIKDTASGEYLRGFASWEAVDGALINYIICGPLHWLGITNLASQAGQDGYTAFQVQPGAAGLLTGVAPAEVETEDAPIQVASSGRIKAPRLCPRPVRYQLARLCQQTGFDREEYIYQVTPEALEQARKQGLRASHLISLLGKHSAAPLPPSLVKALNRWEQSGVQAHLEPALVLRVQSPEIITALRASPAGRFLGDLLGPTAVIVHEGAAARVMAALAGMGYLASGSIQDLTARDKGI